MLAVASIMIAYLHAHVLEENHCPCFAHQTDSFISFAFYLNYNSGLEKLMQASLLSPLVMLRLCQWEETLNTCGVFDRPGSEW